MMETNTDTQDLTDCFSWDLKRFIYDQTPPGYSLAINYTATQYKYHRQNFYEYITVMQVGNILEKQL